MIDSESVKKRQDKSKASKRATKIEKNKKQMLSIRNQKYTFYFLFTLASKTFYQSTNLIQIHLKIEVNIMQLKTTIDIDSL
ncbi:unnamed protein product [Paramecium octaurelia]|uniref:Uncharacterized protein n=1 Tax=Paramecium octaurelia TaxID=43137 RepID=A0A8S1U8L4_PAROT|nr:unnamed protein product [Paramecium octaurelia]